MASPNRLANLARLDNPWWKNRAEDFDKLVENPDLPKKNQWGRFRQVVSDAATVDQIEKFLAERNQKAKTKRCWVFEFDKTPFHLFLLETFVQPVKKANALQKLQGAKYFGMDISPFAEENFEKVKLAAVKRALLDFIDRVALSRDVGRIVAVKNDDGQERLEVKNA